MKQEKTKLPIWLQGKFIVLVGLMGAGKTKLGRMIASMLDLPFIDADMEIEKAAGCSVQEIFENFGEDYFRKGEYRVIKRILNNKPAVLATGGGAYMNKETRKEISKYGIAIWLRADLDLLLKRTGNRSGRPLLEKGDKRKIIAGLIEERYPVYAESEFIIDVSDEPARETARKIIEAVISQAQRDKPKKKK